MAAYDEMPHELRLAGVHGVGPAGDVDDGVRERLVHRDPRVAEATDAALVAERLAQRLPQHDRGVLDRVVGVELDVARGVHRQVEGAVLAERVQHVVEERDAGGDVGLPGAVEVDLDDDLRLLGDPFHAPHSCHYSVSFSTASNSTLSPATCRNASFSSGVPIVTRSRCAMPTSRISTPRS